MWNRTNVYNMISLWESTKEIWDVLRITFEGTQETKADLTRDVNQKGDAEIDESLASKMFQCENLEVDETTDYLTYKFQKLVSKVEVP